MVEHTLEKICGAWYIWAGAPPILSLPTAIAGPFAKRHEAMQAAHDLSVARHWET